MKLIDADKLLEWLDKQTENAFNQDINAQDAYMITKWAAEEGKFDPTPVQPDIKPGDKVIHKQRLNYGTGTVQKLRVEVNFGHFVHDFNIDQLEVIKDEN